MMKKLLCTLLFAIIAIGFANAQSINVTGQGIIIVGDGTNTPGPADDTDFGSVDVASGSVTHTFTITNTTAADLILLGLDPIAGANAGDFSQDPIVNPILSGGQSTTFDVTFDPNSPAGLKTAIISVGVNNLSSGLPETYFFNIQGTATAIVAPDIDVIGNAISIVTPDLTPSVTDDTDFGSVDVASGSVVHTFTIANTGNAPLNLTGASLVFISGGAGDFTVTNLPTTPIPALSSTTFDITFNPSSTGTITANVLIQNDDPDEGAFLFSIQGVGSTAQPEIEVVGNGAVITTPDFTPSVTDDTDFGQADTTVGSVTHTFTINNTGNAPLNLTGAPLVAISGGGGDFTVTNFPTTPIPALGSSTFDITFDPSTTGVISANVLIQNDDADENNFVFSIQGEGIVIPLVPEMDVFGNATEIVDGDTTPDVADATDYGQIDVTSGNVSTTFTIENNGTGDLTLTDASPYITISGVNASDFSISSVPAGTIAAAGSSTFAITFNPSALGIRTATISIANDDADENPYNFDIQGEGIDANAGSPLLITQYYEGLTTTDRWIEVKNISTSATIPGSFYLNLFQGLNGTINGGIASNIPDQSVLIPSLGPGEVVLFQRSGAALPLAGNRGAVSTITTEVCAFSGDDIILISTTNDATAYNSRTDIIGSVGTNAAINWGPNTSLIKGCGTVESASTTYSASEYITLTLDEVNDASTSSNVALGIQTVGPTIWTTLWDNGAPDKTKATIINGTYTAAAGSFEACDLTVNGSASINFDGGTSNYVQVDNNLTINGTFIIGDTESLLMINPDAIISGQISKIENSTTLNNFRDFTYWSAPVSTTIESAFPGVERIFQRNIPSGALPGGGSEGEWVVASGAMDAGRGYIAEASTGTPDGGQHIVTFTGTPNNGLVSETVGFFNDSDTETDFNLIGNPYPSAIDIDEFILLDPENEEINNLAFDGTIYLWTHSTQISNGTTGDFVDTDYASYNLSGGTASANGGPAPTQYIGSGQGFMVRTYSNGTLNFTNNMRVQGLNTQFFKAAKVVEERDRLWLNITSEQGAFNQILVGFFDKATDGEDRGYDGLSNNAASLVSFYSTIGSSKYGIQGLGAFDQSKQVTLGFDTQIARTFKIAIDNIEGVLKDEDVYLVDNVLNNVHDLKQGAYDFEVTEAGSYADRFTLQFNKTTLGVDDVALNNSFVVINEENAFRLKSNSVITNIKIYDITGRLLIDQSPNENEFTVQTRSITKGTVLILNATLEGGAEVSKKAIKY
tara:strand:- start:125075 stop:128854 length:3780 start_codon:yes stop_codon:yes gene_type:complete